MRAHATNSPKSRNWRIRHFKKFEQLLTCSITLAGRSGFYESSTVVCGWFRQARRDETALDFTVAPIERLPETIEIALFRVLQESLTNVHRHSGTSKVDVRFRREVYAVILEGRDYGRGMPLEVLSSIAPPATPSGVGLAGMRQRFHKLRGP
jgi:signal transduction histidine kinase